MKKFRTIIFLIWLPLCVSAQSVEPNFIDPVTGLLSSTNAGEQFNIDPATGLAVETNRAFAKPLQGLDKMADEADLVFKGHVISTHAETNAAFPYWGKAHMTTMDVISVLKGNASTNKVVFLHNTHGPDAWGGGTPPPHYVLEPGRCYLIFAEKTENPAVFRQLSEGITWEDDGATLVTDTRPLTNLTIKEAHWLELNRLLTDGIPSDEIHAIWKLNRMSERCGAGWGHTHDFAREAVLQSLQQLAANTNDEVAVEAINCFQVGGVIDTKVAWSDHGMATLPIYPVESNCISQVRPFADSLIQVANTSKSVSPRVAALVSLFGTGFPAVSNSLPRWLRDPAEDVRVEAVRLLRDFPEGFAEQALRERAEDKSAKVRSVVAIVIGDGRYDRLLPTLAKLFNESDETNSKIKLEDLKAGLPGESTIGDVHTSAGMSLVKFAPDQISNILKTHLDDPGFHINFVAKLAENDAEPWLPELVSILETREKYVTDIAGLSGGDPRKYSDLYADLVLVGTYGKCWEDVRQFLLKQSSEDLAGGKYDRYMDLLEKLVWHDIGCAGCSRDEPQNLYAFYRSKGLEKRAKEVRQRFKDLSANFDEVDRNMK